MAVIQMSERELTRLRVLVDLSDDRLTVETAGTSLGLGRHQVIACVVRLPPRSNGCAMRIGTPASADTAPGSRYRPSAFAGGYTTAVRCPGNSSVGVATLTQFSLRPTHSS
jgi:hypothetical protein